jgi:hypothetical protein
MAGWMKEAKLHGEVIIKGKRGYKGRPLMKVKFWELKTMTKKPQVCVCLVLRLQGVVF